MKRFISFIISLCIIAAVVVPAIAVEPIGAKVFDVYQNNMLFQQNEKANIAGYANNGSTIEVYLYTKDHTLVTSSETVAEDGKFIVSFNAPKGSFEEYTVVLKADGRTFKTLTGVVFGELWLASGQSNMELYMKICASWEEYKKQGYGSKWVRVLTLPSFPEYDDIGQKVPLSPQDNVPGADWARACDENIDMATAVGVYFAHQLMDKLSVPVGILNAPLGGSRIESWISREKLENDATALNLVKKFGSYFNVDEWVEYEPNTQETANNWTGHISTNFNGRISPLRNFRIKGMIWYQGEANMGCKKEEYAHLFNLLIEQNTETFSYKNGNLPVIYSQLASYDYRTDGVYMQDFNYGLALMQNQDPQNRACISIYDLPLTFTKNYFTIHPTDKKPIGVRMSESALKMVYGYEGEYTAALMSSFRTEGNDVYVTFSNTSNGLKTKNNEEVRGFALCGEDGVYYRADAEIVSPDTVKVTSESVTNPVGVTYAYYYLNDRANLYSSYDNELIMPVSPFIGNYEYQSNIYCDFGWADCESEQIWKNVLSADKYNDKLSGYYDSWDTTLCRYKVSPSSAYKGSAGLNIKSFSKVFSVGQTNVIEKFNEKTGYVTSQDRNWTKYGALKFMVKNNGCSNVSIKCKVETPYAKFNPALNGNSNISFSVPSDGQWHEVEMNLNMLFKDGKADCVFNSSELYDIKDFKIIFSSTDIQSDIDLDEFSFASQSTVENNNGPQTQKNILSVLIDILRKVFSFFI